MDYKIGFRKFSGRGLVDIVDYFLEFSYIEVKMELFRDNILVY